MEYSFKAHETEYNGTVFRSRLEARWAAFFDLLEWKWVYEPVEVSGWLPDFMVRIPCYHSECQGEHVLLVEIKPYHSINQFSGHKCTRFYFGGILDNNNAGQLPFDSSACFGIDPHVSHWEMAHGSGGGVFEIETWVNVDIDLFWRKAGNNVQYKHGVK